MKIKFFASYYFLSIFLFTGCREIKKEDQSEEPGVAVTSIPILEEGNIEAFNDRLWSFIPKDAKIEILADGHDWTEGPLWLADHEMLLYSDIPRNAVYAWKEGDGASVYLQPSGFLGEDFQGVEPGANGLILDKDGALVLCQHGERQVARMDGDLQDPKPEFTVLTGQYNGKRFNSPNDAAYRSNGDLYFTDPPYGLPKQMDDPGKELTFQGVYRLDPGGTVTLLTDKLSRPNGIAFSPDEEKLYVANSDPEEAIWTVFTMEEDGTLGEGSVLYDATELVADHKGLPDGLKVDASGNIFGTGPGGVFIFAPSGEALGRINTGQATSNCAFNEDKSVLFITADRYVLRVKLKG